MKSTSPNSTESQNKAITDYMLAGGKVTQLDAYSRFGCVNLSGRISEIGKVHTITKEWIKTKSKKRVIRYGIAFTLILFLLSSCIEDTGRNYEKIPLGNKTIESFEFEGCEYIFLRRYGSVAIVHKGNCKNPIHGN